MALFLIFKLLHLDIVLLRLIIIIYWVKWIGWLELIIIHVLVLLWVNIRNNWIWIYPYIFEITFSLAVIIDYIFGMIWILSKTKIIVILKRMLISEFTPHASKYCFCIELFWLKFRFCFNFCLFFLYIWFWSIINFLI